MTKRRLKRKDEDPVDALDAEVTRISQKLLKHTRQRRQS